jgi:dolichol-phosphate mannosyltransferase
MRSDLVGSAMRFFPAQWVADSDVDIAARLGDVGHWRLRRRTAMAEYASANTLRYENHLGHLGASR